MEIDVDPLMLTDPLDCRSNNVEGKDEDEDEKWFIQLKPEIVSDILVIGVNADSEDQIKAGSKLRVRKSKNSIDWESMVETGKRKTKIRRDNHLKKYRLTKGKRIHACEICRKTFIHGSRLNEHISSHHRRLFSCHDCGESFDRSENMQGRTCAEHDPDVHQGQIADEIDTTEEGERKGGGGGEEEENQLVRESKRKSARDKSLNCKRYYDQLKSKRKYQCEICRKTFITVGHLNTHMYCHFGKKWKCDSCGRNFSCERSLIRHKDTFPGDHWFPCLYCDMNFFRSANLVKHTEIKHPEASTVPGRFGDSIHRSLENTDADGDEKDGKSWICTKCPKAFENWKSLKIHEEAIHWSNGRETEGKESVRDGEDGVPKYKCDVCSKEFISLEGFEYHKNNQHVEKQPSKFKKRKKDDFGEEPEMVDEEENEDSRSPSNFACKICSESFPLKSSLQAHLKTHNVTKNVEVKPGSHRCCICPRTFASSDGLKYHLATHTGERRHSCGQCGKKFIKKTHLFEHVATHSKIKYFRCVRCPRTFSTYSAYRKHVKHFPGPHSFPCTKCGKLFTKESMIEKHTCVDLMKVTMAPEVKALLGEEKTTAEEERSKRQESKSSTEEIKKEKIPSDDSCNVKQSSDNDSPPHSCYKCFKVFPSLSMLQTHQYDHIGKQQYQCRFCPENFKRADDFSAHIRNHLGSSPYMCLKCNRKFISPLTLSMHAKKYPGEHSFTCGKCQRWFPSEKRLEKHECILQNAEAFVCACGSSFKNWNEFVLHAGSKPYKCCSCDLKYLTLVALTRHIKKHTGLKPFTCELCGKSFRSKINYLNHKNVHEGAKEIRCDHCEFKSKSQKRMDFHLFRKHNIGSNTSSTLCPICGIIFPYMTHMKKHVEMEHGNDSILEESKEVKKSLSTVLCTLCGKLLSNKYMLANHMKKVHDPNAPENDEEFKCDFCEEKFKSKKRLQRHSTVHEAPGLRICEICSKEFYFAKDLRKHMRRHDTNKPYSCSKCGKNFKVSVSLKYHSSICGNVNVRTSSGGSKRRKEEKLSNDNLYYGQVEPLELKNRSCPAFYRRWNTGHEDA